MRDSTKAEQKKQVSLYKQWGQVSFSPADGRWTMETLQRNIISLARLAADKEEKLRQAEVAQYQDSNECAARSALRGTMKEFASIPNCYSTDDRRVRQAAIWAQQILDSHSDKADKFADDYAKHPRDAMRYADEYFKHAGEWEVARKFKLMVNDGRSEAFILTKVIKEIMQGAARTNSNQACSCNFSSQMELVAWTKLKKYLDGRKSFI